MLLSGKGSQQPNLSSQERQPRRRPCRGAASFNPDWLVEIEVDAVIAVRD
jgi:hypothetical protein